MGWKAFLGALGFSFFLGALWGFAVGRGYPIPDLLRAFFVESLQFILGALIVGLVVSGVWWFFLEGEAKDLQELKEELTEREERLRHEWKVFESRRRKFEEELDSIRENVKRETWEAVDRQISNFLKKVAKAQEQIYGDSLRTAEEEIKRLQGEVKRLKHELKVCNDRVSSLKGKLTNHVLTLIPGIDQALLIKALKRRKDLKTIRDRLRKL